MSRSGYVDDYKYMNIYRANVDRSIAGKKGQVFLRDLAKAMDEMPNKRLISGELITEQGEVCAIGSVCKMRKLDVSEIDYEDALEVGEAVGISRSMAAEIEYLNDECCSTESPEGRWIRMRKWVHNNIGLDS